MSPKHPKHWTTASVVTLMLAAALAAGPWAAPMPPSLPFPTGSRTAQAQSPGWIDAVVRPDAIEMLSRTQVMTQTDEVARDLVPASDPLKHAKLVLINDTMFEGSRVFPLLVTATHLETGEVVERRLMFGREEEEEAELPPGAYRLSATSDVHLGPPPAVGPFSPLHWDVILRSGQRSDQRVQLLPAAFLQITTHDALDAPFDCSAALWLESQGRRIDVRPPSRGYHCRSFGMRPWKLEISGRSAALPYGRYELVGQTLGGREARAYVHLAGAGAVPVELNFGPE